MKIIVGLRNPQAEYAGTRHNAGAEAAALLAERRGERLRRGPRRVRCDQARLVIDGRAAVIGIPRLSMNVCGPAVAALLAYHRAQPDDLLLIHDDMDLAFARMRLHHGRGAGGHNGVRSVIAALGVRDFWRLKLGIGRPPGRMDPVNYVLGRFTAGERPEMDLLTADAADAAEMFVADPQAAAEKAGRRAAPG